MCPSDLQKFVDGLQDDEPIELYFSCLGGDVLGGLQICSILSDAQKKGHKTIANVTSIAASMASVVACACQELNLYTGAFLMCHLPWTMTMGNSKDLQKEIATLDQMKKAMVKFYKTKFSLSDEKIDEMLENETWIDSDNYKEYGLNCNIIENTEPMKIAASISDRHFKNVPERILSMNKKQEVQANIEEEEKIEEPTNVEDKADETKEEEPVVEEPVEEPSNDDDKEEVKEEEKEEVEEPSIDDLKAEIEKLNNRISELEKENEDLKSQCEKEKGEGEVVTKDECEKRVSGMQAKMQTQINDFKNQLKSKDEELTKAMAQVTSLTDDLKNTSDELLKMTSAFEDKAKALDMLNANVNAHAEELPTLEEGLAKCASPSEKVAFLKSGRYISVK